MGNEILPIDEPATEILGERKLRGVELNGSEQQSAVDHFEYERERKPDTELRLDAESDALYDDGIDLEADFDTLAGTTASSGTVP